MITIKAEFRRIFGYDFTHQCKECKYCVKRVMSKVHYKCEKMGMSHSSATDIRLKDAACRLFEEESDG